MSMFDDLDGKVTHKVPWLALHPTNKKLLAIYEDSHPDFNANGEDPRAKAFPLPVESQNGMDELFSMLKYTLYMYDPLPAETSF